MLINQKSHTVYSRRFTVVSTIFNLTHISCCLSLFGIWYWDADINILLVPLFISDYASERCSAAHLSTIRDNLTECLQASNTTFPCLTENGDLLKDRITEMTKEPSEYGWVCIGIVHSLSSIQFSSIQNTLFIPGTAIKCMWNSCTQTQNKSASKEHGQHVKYRRQHASYTDPNQVRQNKHRLNKSNKILIEVQSSTEVGWTVVKRQQQVSANVKIVCSSNTCSQFCKINLKSTCLSVLLQTFSLEHEK